MINHYISKIKQADPDVVMAYILRAMAFFFVFVSYMYLVIYSCINQTLVLLIVVSILLCLGYMCYHFSTLFTHDYTDSLVKPDRLKV